MKAGTRTPKNPEMYAVIGKNLRIAMGRDDITIEMLAEWADVPMATVTRYRSGNAEAMTLHTLDRIAQALRVTLEWLTEEHNA